MFREILKSLETFESKGIQIWKFKPSENDDRKRLIQMVSELDQKKKMNQFRILAHQQAKRSELRIDATFEASQGVYLREREREYQKERVS